MFPPRTDTPNVSNSIICKPLGKRGEEKAEVYAYLSGETFGKSDLLASVVWMRRETVRTNWPTQAPKPDRKAL